MRYPTRHTKPIRHKKRNRGNTKRTMLIQFKKVPFWLINPFFSPIVPSHRPPFCSSRSAEAPFADLRTFRICYLLFAIRSGQLPERCSGHANAIDSELLNFFHVGFRFDEGVGKDPWWSDHKRRHFSELLRRDDGSDRTCAANQRLL